MPLLHLSLRLGPLENNTYVLACQRTRHCAIIDVGFEADVVIRKVRGAGLDVRLLLNTHAHYDHVAGMRAVQQAVGGEYWLHPADRPLLALLSEQGAAFGFPPSEPPREVHDLADAQRIALGDEMLEVMHTPGHSPGSVCFRRGAELWVGDTLFAGSIGRTDLPGGSFEQIERSIRTRIFPLGDEVRCLPGHGAATTVGEERLHNPFVGERASLT